MEGGRWKVESESESEKRTELWMGGVDVMIESGKW